MSNSNMPEAIAAQWNAMKSGAADIMAAGEKGDLARGTVIAAFLLIGAADVDQARVFGKFARVAVTARTDENKSEVKAAQSYFLDKLDCPDRLTQKDESDPIRRARHNNKVQALQQTVTFIAKCLLAVDHAKAWSEFTASKNKANKGTVRITAKGAKMLWPNKAEAIDATEADHLLIAHRAGPWKFTGIAEAGEEVMRHLGIAKARAERGKVAGIGDLTATAKQVSELVESVDVKDLNRSPEAQAVLFSACVSILDMLNDKTFARALDNSVVAPIRDALSRGLEEATKAAAAAVPKKDAA